MGLVSVMMLMMTMMLWRAVELPLIMPFTMQCTSPDCESAGGSSPSAYLRGDLLHQDPCVTHLPLQQLAMVMPVCGKGLKSADDNEGLITRFLLMCYVAEVSSLTSMDQKGKKGKKNPN